MKRAFLRSAAVALLAISLMTASGLNGQAMLALTQGEGGSCLVSTHPALVGIASVAIPGAGQLINDEFDKTLIHLGLFIGIYTITPLVGDVLGRLSRFIGNTTYRLIPVLHGGLAIFSGWDAYQVHQTKCR